MPLRAFMLLWALVFVPVTANSQSDPEKIRPNDPQAQVSPVPAKSASLPRPPDPVATSGPPVDARVISLETQIQNLKDQISFLSFLVIILFALLALGGGLGVVFSIRDQRRISQIHELTIAGEQASQRRSEDSYATFIDASQKTLALVNDTLQLAKEATQRANETMTLRAERSLSNIGEQTQDLLEKVLYGDFKRIVTEPSFRMTLEGLGKELAAIEGYLSLQAIALQPECVFVQGMCRHLQNDARGALRLLQRVAQEGVSRDLRCLAQYWIGYLHNNKGEYREAAEIFRAAMQHLPSDATRYLELERIMWETEFFLAAQSCSSEDTTIREEAVKAPLDHLEKLASKAQGDPTRYEKVSQSIAGTRGNILTWIANVQNNNSDDQSRNQLLRRAKSCYEDAGRGLFARFGHCESRYYLGENIGASEYSSLEQEAIVFLRSRREPRNTANLCETILIVRYRLCLPGANVSDTLRELYKNVQTALGEIRDEEITVFSQFEKRNVSQHQFAIEVENFYSTCVAETSPDKQVSAQNVAVT